MMFLRGYRGFGFGRGLIGCGAPFMPLIMAFVFVALIVVAVLMIKKTKRLSNNKSYDASLEELKIEFVKGNVSEEEYLRKKKILSE